MKKLLLALLFFTAITNAQIVNIPDVNFKNRLIALGKDTNADGNIQQSEALAVTGLSVANSNISDLTGINAFQNLISLNCADNSISSLNISIPGLLSLLCQNNNMNSININGCTSLSNFDASYNDLTSLDFSNVHSIQAIRAEVNSLTSINLSGCTQLYFLYVAGSDLTSIDLTGLISLQELYIHSNELTALNVTSLSSLTKIWCSNNQLTTLNVSGLSNLEELVVNSNGQLASLNMTGCTALVQVQASYNNLSSISTLGCTALMQLNIDENNFNNNPLALVNLPSLVDVFCTNSSLSSLNIIGCPQIAFLTLDYNNLTTFDASALFNLLLLTLDDNNLSTLFVKNGRNEDVLSIDNNPNLAFVCADETQLSTIQLQNENMVVSSYCSFEPGGNYNTLSGVVIFDLNNNGCDASDNNLSGFRLNLNDGVNQGSSFTNSNGNYGFYLGQGNFTVTPNIENSTWFNFSPVSSTVSFANNNNNTTTQNFCVTANGVHNDLEIVIVPLTTARPGFDVTYKVIYKNKGNQMFSGDINFTYEDDVMDYVSSSVATNAQSFGNLNWTYANLYPFETRSFTVVFNVNSPLETPAVNIGDQLDLGVNINPVIGDDLPADNEFGFKHIVVGSLDPNDKTCLEGDIVSPANIGGYLHYNINFENTGNFQAENIVVKDMIDTAVYDINSLQVLNASHTMVTRILGDKVEFIFENINLAAQGHGNVTFKIKTKNTLVTGNTVTNKADIYFDYNAPVITNIASTTFQTLSINENQIDNSIKIYPNPASNFIQIEALSNIKSIELFDVQGRILTTKIPDNTQTNMDISTCQNGVYFLKVSTDIGIKVQKIVKE